jgi:predicted transcriptional regulator of viral defense system
MPGRNYTRLFELAEDDYGYFTAEEARDAGVHPRRLGEMAKRGTIRRVSFGVYRIEQFPVHELDTYAAATLWPHGVRGVISHETALDLYGLSDVNPAKIHITVPKAHRIRRRPLPELYVIHHEDLAGEDVTRHEGLPIVTAAKAVRQCATEHLRRDLVEQALEDGRRAGLIGRAEYDVLVRELGAARVDAP